MRFVALSYPNVPEAHQRFMDQVRDRHDPAYKDVVRPHFSLIFPVRDIPEPSLLTHVQAVAAKHKSIYFTCRYAMTHDDRASDNWYVFLVPDEGFSEIDRLHDDLYTGLLAPSLLLDRPYLPHIGIATSKDKLACKRLADELNGRGFEVSGTVDAIWISEYDGMSVMDRHQIPLESCLPP
jgi:2'-5' RNA ligase